MKTSQKQSEQLVLDGHAHCGLTVPYHGLAAEWRHGGINGGVVFSPVEEIYNRHDPRFRDSPEYVQSREKVHRYLLDLALREPLYPFFFVWNDFPEMSSSFLGVKWHRHSGEPVYSYGSQGCQRFVAEICKRKLPVVLEEEFSNTLDFLHMIEDRTVVIIPHLGALNGGYRYLKAHGVFDLPNVWADTALAGDTEIADFAKSYGTDRLMFGSDYPFGVPSSEKIKLFRHFSGEDLSAVLGGNLVRLLGQNTGEGTGTDLDS